MLCRKQVVCGILYFYRVYIIKNKFSLTVICVLMLSSWLVSSCNKGDETSSVDIFLTSGLWRLASVRVQTLHGDTTIRRDTLNTTCRFNQTFTFDRNGQCTYEYFSCIDQVTKGNWQLIRTDSVILRSGMVSKDTSKLGTTMPFRKAQVVNLGQNSLVLEVVLTDTLRRLPVVVLRRRITRYGFIH